VVIVSSALDKLLRVLDLVDIKTFKRLVLVESDEDLNMFKSFLGDEGTAYLLIHGPQNSVSNFWFEIPEDSFREIITSFKPYVVGELTDLVVYISLTPSNLVITYEVLKEVKVVCGNTRKVLFIKVNSPINDDELTNILTYFVRVVKEDLVNYVVIISKDLLKYLRLISDDNSLIKCLDIILRNSEGVENYLRRFNKLGVVTCLPKIDLEIFNSLLNVVRFSLHLIGDYSGRLGTALLIIYHNFKDLNLEISSVGKYFMLSDLHMIEFKDLSNVLTVVVIMPVNKLLGGLDRVVKVYEVIRGKNLSISLDDLTGIVGR
jgi:hypothetical protein